MSKSFAKARQDGYMPIKDFAQLAGVSNQAVYLKIKNNAIFAEKYTAVIENRRMIHESALEEYGVKPDAPEAEPKQDESKDELIQVLKDTIADLKRQIAVKDSQIERIMQSLLQEQSLMLIRRQEAPETTAQTSKAPETTAQADIQHSVQQQHDEVSSGSGTNTQRSTTGQRRRFFGWLRNS